MFKFLCVIPFILYFVNPAFALKCYECDSSKNVACDYGLLSFTMNVKDCSEDAGFLSFVPSACNKIVAKDKHGNQYIARGCGINTGPINGCQAVAKMMQFAAVDGDLSTIDCFSCNTDKCNSATNIQAFSLIGVLTACLLYLL